MLKRVKRYRFLYLLMLPGILWYIAFHIMPLYGITIAFKDFRPVEGILGSEWVGLKHFNTLLGSAAFSRILLNTIKISFFRLIIGFPAPIILAISINSVTNKMFKKVTQTISYLPNFISWVIVVGISFAVFNDYYGIIKKFTEIFGSEYTNITTNAETFIGFIVASGVWKSVGMGSIIYLAALSGIDPQLYEAATVDGAGKIKQLIHITIPSIMPICAIVLILQVGAFLSGDFEQIFLFQGNNPDLIRISDIFETFIFRNGIRAANFSFPAAVGIFQSMFGAMLILLTNKLAKTLGYEGIW